MASGYIALWVDGTLTASAAGSVAWTFAHTLTLHGRSLDTATYVWSGTTKAFAIFNRPVSSAEAWLLDRAMRGL